MNELEKQDLLEKYIGNGLTTQEKHLFQNLQATDSSFQEDIDFFQNFNQIQLLFGRDELKKELVFLEESLQKEATPNLLSKLSVNLHRVNKKIHYSIEELIKLFSPEPEYQLALNKVRGNDLEVVTPQSGIEASVGGLKFELKSKLELQEPVQLMIQNNQKQTLLTTTIVSFDENINIDTSELIPGRYYWKIITDKETLIGEFFVQKKLMPS